MCHQVICSWDLMEKNLDFLTTNRARDSVNTLAWYLNILCLAPLLNEYDSKLDIDFVRIVEHSMDKYLLSDIITGILIKAVINTGSC